jgi:hypothetical protein
LQKTKPDKVWNFFPAHAPKQVKAFFSVAIISEVGNEKNTYFLVRQMAAWAKIGAPFRCIANVIIFTLSLHHINFGIHAWSSKCM